MAIVKYGMIVTEIKGKLGSHVFQKCGQGYALRSQLSQKFASSFSGFKTRSNMSLIANTWGGFDVSLRDAWSTAAFTYPATDRFGRSIVYTGYQYFIFINRTLQLMGQPIRTAPADYNPVATLFSLGSTLDYSAQTLYYTCSVSLPAGANFVFYSSVPLPLGSVFAKSNKVYLSFDEPDGSGSSNIGSIFTVSFSESQAVNKQFYVEVWCVLLVSGSQFYVGTYPITCVP
jgi:hypothetical protein